MGIVDSNCHLEKRGIPGLLREMDGLGVERAAIGPAKNFTAVDNRAGNSYIAEAVRKHPDRFVGYAVASPWYGKKAPMELGRALDLGLSGLMIDPALQGFILTDPQIHPLVEFAADAGWPVYCATGTPVYAMPFQLAELAERYPSVHFVMGHGGFSDFWYDVPDSLRRCPNLWLETSYVLPTQLGRWIEDLGVEKFVFGSDHPYSSLALELDKIRLLKEDIDRRPILEANFAAVMRGRA